IGRMGIVTSFILLSFYSVVGGWILFYMIKTLTGSLSSLTDHEYSVQFDQFISHPSIAVISQFAFIIITILVVARVVQQGIEQASNIMMRALFIFFVILIIRSLTLNGAMEGVTFFLHPNFSNLNSQTILFALGQSFFAISVGVSVMVTYSSYLPKNEDLPKSAFTVVIMNIMISLLAGLAIF